MILTLNVRVDVPSLDWVPYIKKILMGRLGWCGVVKSIDYDAGVTHFENERAKIVERDAYDRGLMEF